MDTFILHQNSSIKQHTPQDAFNQAFNTTSQETIQLNSDSDKVNFVISKIAFYTQRIEQLEKELHSAKVLLTGHKTWAAELVKKLEGEK